MGFEKVPRRVFLDTCVVNFILDYGEQIHENVSAPAAAGDRVVQDIDALHDIFLTGQRAMWQLAVSPHTYQEVIQTRDAVRRHHLETWFFEIWQYWRGIIDQDDDLPSFIEAEHSRLQLLASGLARRSPRDSGPRPTVRCCSVSV